MVVVGSDQDKVVFKSVVKSRYDKDKAGQLCKSIRASAVKSFSVVHAQDAPSLTILPCKAQLTVMRNIIGKL